MLHNYAPLNLCTSLQLISIEVNGVELLFLLLRIGKPSMENMQLL